VVGDAVGVTIHSSLAHHSLPNCLIAKQREKRAKNPADLRGIWEKVGRAAA